MLGEWKIRTIKVTKPDGFGVIAARDYYLFTPKDALRLLTGVDWFNSIYVEYNGIYFEFRRTKQGTYCRVMGGLAFFVVTGPPYTEWRVANVERILNDVLIREVHAS